MTAILTWWGEDSHVVNSLSIHRVSDEVSAIHNGELNVQCNAIKAVLSLSYFKMNKLRFRKTNQIVQKLKRTQVHILWRTSDTPITFLQVNILREQERYLKGVTQLFIHYT